MVKIRLTQKGKKHQRSYRIIVVDRRKKRDTGKYLEELGSCYYNPKTKKIELKNKLKDKDKESIKKWLERGAQPTESAAEALVEILN